MTSITLEEAFEIRDRITNNTGKYSPERGVLQNILNGAYENTGTEDYPIAEAYNDLYALAESTTSIIPVVGQVYKIKEENKRSFREDILTINWVSVGTNKHQPDNYFTFEEQPDAGSCWSFELLDLYCLVKENK